MTLDQRRDSRPRRNQRCPSIPRRLPLRWAVILGLCTALGLVVGATAGLAAGLVAAVFALGTLHAVVG